MTTQLYKRLKDGTTLYVLPGAAEDLNAAYQNTNLRMTYSKFVLLKLPARRVPLQTSGATHKAVFDIENNPAFYQATATKVPATWGEAVVESLRNYVANHESVVRATRLNATDYLYNTNELRTVSERVFWKWLRKNNALELEPALPNEEWTPSAAKFAPAVDNQPSYLQKYLWRERLVEPYLMAASSPIVDDGNGNMEITFQRTTNFRPGDYLKFYGVSNIADGATRRVVEVFSSGPPNGSVNDGVRIELPAGPLPAPLVGQVPRAVLDYEPVVKYVGEITAQNNVVGAVSSSTDVWAHVPGQSGRTHSVLFDVVADDNYRPNLTYPILTEQMQAEINGAENPLSPIVANMQDYPGDYIGQFDTAAYEYAASTGDYGRRSGAYYGIGAAVVDRGGIPYTNDQTRPMAFPEFDGRELDGVTIDFDLSDYLLAAGSNSFGEFSASSVNNRAPEDFEFNAVLWYYDMEDVGGGNREKVTNLYGIQFMDNPDRESLDATTREIIPSLRKQVANGLQDGTAFSINMSLVFQVDSEDSPMAYDPDRVYSLFGFEMYNEVMGRVASLTDTYNKTLTQVIAQRSDVQALRSQIFSQQALETLRDKIKNLEELLKLYATVQIGPSDSIVPTLDASANPPVVRLNSVDKRYSRIIQVNAKDLYTKLALAGGNKYVTKPLNVSFPAGKDFLVVVNNDDDNAGLSGTDTTARLEIVLDKDLDYKQTAEFLVKPTPNASADKGLSIYVKYDDTTGITNQLLVGPLDLPVSQTSGSQEPSVLTSGTPRYQPYAMYYEFLGSDTYQLVLDFEGDLTHLPANGRMYLNDFRVITGSGSSADQLNLSGQYTIASAVTYIPSPIVHATLTLDGTTTTSGTTAHIAVATSPVTTEMYSSTATLTELESSANCHVLWKLKSPGVVDKDHLYVLRAGDGFLPNGPRAELEVLLVDSGVTWQSPPPMVTLVPQTRSRVHLRVQSAVLNGLLGATPPPLLETRRSMTSMLTSLPYMDFNRGYRIQITRYNEQADTVPSRKFDRYNVNIDRL